MQIITMMLHCLMQMQEDVAKIIFTTNFKLLQMQVKHLVLLVYLAYPLHQFKLNGHKTYKSVFIQ